MQVTQQLSKFILNILKRIKLIKFDRWEYLLISILGIFFILNLIWILVDKTPLMWDEAGHTLSTYEYFVFFKQPSPDKNLFDISQYYPPLVYIYNAMLMLVLVGKESQMLPQITNLVLGTLNIYMVYLIAYKLFKVKSIGVITGLLFSLLPFNWKLSHLYFLETPMIFFILLGLYELAKDKISSYKLGIYLALALLTRWFAPIYIIIFLIYALWKRRINLVKLVLPIFLIASPWYLYNLSFLLNRGQGSLKNAYFEPNSTWGLDNLVYNFSGILNITLLWPLAFLFIFFTATYIYKKREYVTEINLILIQCALVYIFFTITPNKDARYVFPILPLLLIFIAYFLFRLRLKYKNLINIITSIIILFYICLVSIYNFGFPINTKDYNTNYSILSDKAGIAWDILNLSVASKWIAPTINTTDYQHDKIISIIKENSYPNRVNRILVLAEIEKFNSSNFLLSLIDYRNNIEAVPFELVYVADIAGEITKEKAEELFKNVDFLLFTDHSYEEFPFYGMENYKKVSEFRKELNLISEDIGGAMIKPNNEKWLWIAVVKLKSVDGEVKR